MFTTIGCILTAQKVNDPHWVRAERRSIEGGVLADGVASLAAGLLGALPVNTSNSAVGLTAATGITSRVVAWPTAAILVLLGCSPDSPICLRRCRRRCWAPRCCSRPVSS